MFNLQKWKRKAFFESKITLSRHSAWYHIRRRTRIFKMLCFKNEAHNQAGNLQRDMFLVHLKPSDIESLAGLLNFDLRILWRNTLGIDSTRSVSYHHFEWAFPSRAKRRVDERRPIAFKTRFFDFPHRGETKKHPWDRIPRGRFHTIILSGLFQAGQKSGLTNVVQLRSKRVFSTFPIGAKRNNTLGIEFHEVGFIPPFWVGFSKQGKKPGWRTSSNCVQNAFFRLSPSGRNEKTPLGSNSTRSVSYHHFEWAFPSRAFFGHSKTTMARLSRVPLKIVQIVFLLSFLCKKVHKVGNSDFNVGVHGQVAELSCGRELSSVVPTRNQLTKRSAIITVGNRPFYSCLLRYQAFEW